MHSLPLGFVTTPTPRASPAPQPTPIPWYPLPPLWIIHVPVWEHFLLPFSTDRWMIPRWSRMEEPPMEHSTVPQVPLTQWWCHLKIRRFHDYICLHFISPSYSLNILFFLVHMVVLKGIGGWCQYHQKKYLKLYFWTSRKRLDLRSNFPTIFQQHFNISSPTMEIIFHPYSLFCIFPFDLEKISWISCNFVFD